MSSKEGTYHFRKPALHKLLNQKIEEGVGFLSVGDGQKSIDDLIHYDEQKNVYVIFNGQDIYDCQKELGAKLLSRIFYEIEDIFDYVIIDSAPVAACSDTEYLKDFCGSSMMVVREDAARISDINDAVEMLKDGRSEFIGYVMNGFHGRATKRYDRYGYGKYGKYTNNTEE